MMYHRKHKPHIKRRPRMVPRQDDGLQVIRVGQKKNHFNDLYVEFLGMTWFEIGVFILIAYFLSNLAFALFYFYNFDGITGVRPGAFEDAFFFSVQTMATIGYGKMAPVSLPVNIAVSIEALWGFSFFAVTTALVFAKFSQPKARVLFSNVAVMGPHNGERYLMFRMANERSNRIVDAWAELFLLRNEMTSEGTRSRKYYDLELVRTHVPLMQLSWTIMHKLDETSPLYGVSQDDLEKMEAEIIVSLHGHDETMSQTIYARHSWVADEILCHAVFEDILNRRDDGFVEVNYKLFHAVKRVGGEFG